MTDVATSTVAAESTWVTASAELRTTARWLITALAAVAVVIFGAGPVIARPSLNFENDWLQLVIAGLIGSAGLIGIGMLIFGVSRVFLPVEMSLDDLPRELLRRIDSPLASSLLPAGVVTLEAFRDRLAALRTSVVEIPDKIEEQEQRADQATKANDPQAYRQATEAANAYRTALDDTRANAATYEAVRSDLIDRGAYTKLSRIFADQRTSLWTGALLAGVGGLGFQLALTSAAAGDGSSDTPPPIEIAVLSVASDRSTEFWSTYGLQACETVPGQIPVLVTGGDGTAASPYNLETIPQGVGDGATKCPSLAFTADPAVFNVVMPKTQEITIKITR